MSFTEISKIPELARKGRPPEEINGLYERLLMFLRLRARRRVGPALEARYDLTDIVADAALKVIAKLGDFRGGSFRGWADGLLNHEILGRVRLIRNRPESPPDGISKVVAEGPGPEKVAEFNEEMGRTLEALKRLPEIDQEIVMLRQFEERTFDEIAQTLGIPLKTVWGRHQRSIERLREMTRAPE